MRGCPACPRSVVRRRPSGVSGPYVLRTSRICLVIAFHCAASMPSSASMASRSLLSVSCSAAELHLLEPAQAAQPRVEDVVGLHLGQREARDQRGLRLVLLADDADHLVEVEVDDQHAASTSSRCSIWPRRWRERRISTDAAMVDPLLQRLGEADDARHDAIDQHVHVERNAGFELGQPEQALHHHRRATVRERGSMHDAHVLGRLVAHVGDERQLLLVEQFGQLLDQPRLLHAVGDLGDDDDPGALARVLLGPAGAHPEGAAPGAVGLGDRVAESTMMPPVGKSGPCTKLDELGRRRVRVGDQVERRVAELGERCGAGSRSPCRPRCPASRWPAGSGTPPAARSAPACRPNSSAGNRPRPRRCPRAAAARPR